jgi:Type IX secretion system protein PorV
MKKNINFIATLLLLAIFSNLNAQCVNGLDPLGRPCRNTIQTAVPFMRITPDARSGGMGDAGIAVEGDANAMHFNSSKMSFSEQQSSVSMTYTPWFRNLGADNLYLANLSGFNQFGDPSHKQAIGIDFRFFSLGTLQWMDANGTRLSEGTPREMSLAIGYSRQLTAHLAVGLTGKYIYSNLASGIAVGTTSIRSGSAGAADLSLTYKKPIHVGDKKSDLMIGVAVSNLGNKITYLYRSDFLPTNLGIGAAYSTQLDPHNALTFCLDVNKLLVPTPDAAGTWQNTGVVDGIFKSFSDNYSASGEKFRELTWSTGAEYWYDKQLALRAGYFYEHESKGGRQYFTTGFGFKYNMYGVNFSYLVPLSTQRNPLGNTLRFSILFDLNTLKKS